MTFLALSRAQRLDRLVCQVQVAARIEDRRPVAARGGRFFRGRARHGHFGRSDLDPPWERPVPLD